MLDHSQAGDADVLDEIILGLTKTQKTLPAKLFYDDEGCRLFGEITRLPEYYVTRTELALLCQIMPKLPVVADCVLVEYGGSDEAKAVMLLDQIGATSYVPIDVAATALQQMQIRLRSVRPGLFVSPLSVDFLQPFQLPSAVQRQAKFGFFPGSTIGNLDPPDATEFLRQARCTLGQGAMFLVGVDLRKDPAILVPAYDDEQGVTAAFNRNLLTHVNRVAGTTFDTACFGHRAIWNPERSRIEMHLVSRRAQIVDVAGSTIAFAENETIHTESSYKHTVRGFLDLAASADWSSKAVWTDEQRMFSLHLLSADGDSP